MQKFAHVSGITAVAFVSLALMAATPRSAAAQGTSMLYLVEFEATASGAPTGPEQSIALLGGQIVPSLEQLAKDGRIRAGGLHVGARSGAFIVAAKSHDEVTALVHALPAWGVWTWKVAPLESFAGRAELEKKVVEELRAAQK